MNTSIDSRQLESLKSLTLAVSGFKYISPGDCRTLSFAIIKQTNLSISEMAIKRLFGFETSKFPPSHFTVDALAVYCGYRSWEEFVQSQPVPIISESNPGNNLLNDPLINKLLQNNIPTVVLQANAPNFTILTYNEAYEDATYTHNRPLTGMSLWEAFDPE